MSSLVLTGCDNSEDFFGTTGTYILGLGEDVFGTGHEGIFGGEDGAEAHSNKNPYRFDDFAVKQVENAPEEEKKEYDFAGPENFGITPKQEQTTSAEGKEIPKADEEENSETNTDTIIVLTCGHSPNQLSGCEAQSRFCYYWLARDVVAGCYCAPSGSVNKELLKNIPKKQIMRGGSNLATSDLRKEFYKLLTGESMASTYLENETKKLYKKLASYGMITGKNNKFNAKAIKSKNPSNKEKKEFYAKNAEKLDKFMDKLNEAISGSDYPKIKNYVDQSIFSAGGNSHHGSESPTMYLKNRSNSGGAYNSMPEWKINYETMKAVGKLLEGKGYKVIYGKDKAKTNKLANGDLASNRNMSLFAAEKKASLHLNFHWDAGTSSSKGMKTISPDSTYSSAGSSSEKIAKAMYNAGKKYFVKENEVSNQYTTLNWAEVPTMIIEDGYMNSADYGKIYDSNEKTRKKNMEKWVEKRKKIFLKAASAVDEG